MSSKPPHGEPPEASEEAEATLCAPNGAIEATIASLRELRLYLHIVEGREAGRWVELGENPVGVGRDSHLDIVLGDGQVSRLHALVDVVAGIVMVEDLGSTNGTFIDGRRVDRRAALPVGSMLRIGDHIFRCERATRADVDRAEKSRRDLQRATNYVLSLLPQPITDGPVRTEWMFLPSARLGGDGFGYEQLDSDTFVLYLIDASGHGVGAAMHSVSVLNVLRQRALPHTDPKDPVQVLASLNAMFQMDGHGDQYFTMWYGVYDLRSRTLTYGSAGHHPAYLVPADRTASVPLRTSGLVVGAMPDARFKSAQARVEPGSSFYLFSDGVFEILTNDRQWRLDDFLPLLVEPRRSGTSECQRLYQSVKAVCRPGPLEDDFSLLVVTFP